MVKTMRNGMKMYDIHKKTYIGKRAERRDHQNDFITKKKKNILKCRGFRHIPQNVILRGKN
jgi:hypothetical protein